MNALRQAAFLARFVLAWFVLSLAAAVASPLVQPQAIELVCTAGGGIKVLVQDEDGGRQVSAHTLDCPLCASVGSPPPAERGASGLALLPVETLRPAPAAHRVAVSAAPLPARGPPTVA